MLSSSILAGAVPPLALRPDTQRTLRSMAPWLPTPRSDRLGSSLSGRTSGSGAYTTTASLSPHGRCQLPPSSHRRAPGLGGQPITLTVQSPSPSGCTSQAWGCLACPLPPSPEATFPDDSLPGHSWASPASPGRGLLSPSPPPRPGPIQKENGKCLISIWALTKWNFPSVMEVMSALGQARRDAWARVLTTGHSAGCRPSEALRMHRVPRGACSEASVWPSPCFWPHGSPHLSATDHPSLLKSPAALAYAHTVLHALWLPKAPVDSGNTQ